MIIILFLRITSLSSQISYIDKKDKTKCSCEQVKESIFILNMDFESEKYWHYTDIFRLYRKNSNRCRKRTMRMTVCLLILAGNFFGFSISL